MADRTHRDRAPRVAAAIDFGTHGTGFAWAPFTRDNDDGERRATRGIKLHLAWHGMALSTGKTLSALLVDRNDRALAWGYPAQQSWLNLDPLNDAPKRAYFESFKLALKQGFDGTFAHMPKDPKEATKVAAMFLRAIRTEAVRVITAAEGCSEDEITWCVTVPAVWTRAEIRRTRRAAEAAGFPAADRLRVVYEPEAAALACRFSGVRDPAVDGVASHGSFDIANGRFMVVDCGGGTVDITSYTVDDDGRLSQVSEISGDLHGSRQLNVAFAADVLGRRFGATSLDSLLRHRNRGFARLIDTWETAKHGVQVGTTPEGAIVFTRPLNVPISREEFQALARDVPDMSERLMATQRDDGAIIVSEHELDLLFAQVVDAIVDDVEAELGKLAPRPGGGAGLETVVLVGGFAKSAYLQRRMAQRLARRAEVRVPEHGDRAVLTGAVHFCYDPSLLRTRRARHTLGVAVTMPFEHGADPRRRRFESDGAEWCPGRFLEIVRAGADVPADYETPPIRLTPSSSSQTKVAIALYRLRARAPRYVDGLAPFRKLDVDVSATAGLDRADRQIDLVFRFGRSTIEAVATDTDSQRRSTTSMEFLHVVETDPPGPGPRPFSGV